jgi:pimeloyl-ACP methyl ester carboxylesterase
MPARSAVDAATAPAEAAPGRWRRRSRRAAIALGAGVAMLTGGSLVTNALTSAPAATPAGLTFVTADGVPTRIRTWGTSGTPIVLVHGAAETADTWDAVARHLAPTHRVYALDLDGWGYSRRVPPYTLDHQTRQLLGLLDTLGLQHPVLAGHSSGAAVVAEAALRSPDRIGGIVLLDGDALATGAGPPPAARYVVIPPYRTTVLRLALRSDALIRAIYGRQCGPRCPALDAAGVDAWRRPLEVGGAEDALWGMLAAGVPGMSPERLTGVAATGVPAAVVFGARDDVFPAGTPEQTARRVGSPAPVLIPDARHLTMISHPGPVAGAIEQLARRARPSR